MHGQCDVTFQPHNTHVCKQSAQSSSDSNKRWRGSSSPIHTRHIRSRASVSPPAPPGDCLWQTLTFFLNPNIEPSSYRYTSTEWFSDMPTNFGLPPVRCSQWHKTNGYIDWLKRSRWYILLYITSSAMHGQHDARPMVTFPSTEHHQHQWTVTSTA